jgi:hypothetical protein
MLYVLQLITLIKVAYVSKLCYDILFEDPTLIVALVSLPLYKLTTLSQLIIGNISTKIGVPSSDMLFIPDLMTIRHWFQNYYVGGGEGEANVRA